MQCYQRVEDQPVFSDNIACRLWIGCKKIYESGVWKQKTAKSRLLFIYDSRKPAKHSLYDSDTMNCEWKETVYAMTLGVRQYRFSKDSKKKSDIFLQ